MNLVSARINGAKINRAKIGARKKNGIKVTKLISGTPFFIL